VSSETAGPAIRAPNGLIDYRSPECKSQSFQETKSDSLVLRTVLRTWCRANLASEEFALDAAVTIAFSSRSFARQHVFAVAYAVTPVPSRQPRRSAAEVARRADPCHALGP
jgi:hypothetical protein